MKVPIIVIFALSIATAAFPATWYVPDHSPTIQGAIILSANGDTVIVRQGVYPENINFMGRAIVVKSEFGPTATTIDGLGLSSVVLFNSGEGSKTMLKGFTITNGSGSLDPYGGMSGGGIHCISSSPIITGNIITENRVLNLGDYGAGICLWASSPVITDNTIFFNSNLSDDGAGISCWDMSNPLISNNFIYENMAAGCAGGIDCARSSPVIYNNCIFMNMAGLGGGAFGGGIRAVGDMLGSADPYILNCTVCDNTVLGAASLGGGIGTWNLSNPTMINTILWGNTVGAGVPDQIYGGGTGPFLVDYCCVEGGLAGVTGTVTWGPGNIANNPLFVAGPQGNYYLSQLASGQPVDSPCLDAGDPTTPMVNGTTRTDQVQDTALVDMGFHYLGGMSLITDAAWLSINGGMVNMSIDAGMGNAGRWYLVLGSLSGSSPGFPLPGGLATLPINWDSFTDFVVPRLNTNLFFNFLNVLDARGQSYAQINAPAVNPNKLGKKMTYAYCLDAAPLWDFASNPVVVEFVP